MNIAILVFVITYLYSVVQKQKKQFALEYKHKVV